MGNQCQRRRNNNIQQEDNEWIVIPAQPNPNRRRLCKVVKKIITLLCLREVWGRAGIWLQKPLSRHPRNVRTKSVIAHIFASWPSTVLRGTKPIFDHLKRENGRLVYQQQ